MIYLSNPMSTFKLSAMDEYLNPAILPETIVSGLYVHIPFCFHKCHYCDFYSITRQTPGRMAGFVDRVMREADFWINGRQAVRPRTVFFGGGTPTLLPVAEMRRLIEGLRARFEFDDLREWTVEANPATVTREYADALAELGINRISMGAQSFNPAELAILERHHDPDDVPRSLEIIRSAGIERMNIDLIYGIPGQDMKSWLASLECAMALGTEHLSCYGLTYEPNTPMAVRKRLGLLTAMEPELEIEMMRETRARLEAVGMPAYEISNYARPGGECRHNLLYWHGGDYIGLGPAAASHMRGTRWRNRPHLGEWENAISKDQLPAIECETLTPNQRAGELAMLMLRLSTGIECAEFADRIGLDAEEIFAGVIDRLLPLGLLEVTETSIRLSERALPVADSVAAEFLTALTS
jgi:oxygen-independent coproporphyrinogen III oxidase